MLRFIGAYSHDMVSSFHSCWPWTFRRKKSSPNHEREREVFSDENLQLFSLSELTTATRGFHSEDELGHGGFGVVYKGLLGDGRRVAVKRLSAGSRQGKQEFVNEVKLLATVQHRNLIRLYGCCPEEVERLLVYEYLPNGSLDKQLFDKEAHLKLNWHTRWRIILGIAKGLTYLHEDSRFRMVHRDIKPSNILLDNSFAPKISDFGVARLFSSDQTHLSTNMAGTHGYLAPEYAFQGKLTEKADVYSFGIVALEIISGRRTTDPNNKLLDLGWTLYTEQRLLELLDCRLMTMEVPGSVGNMSNFADQVQRAAHVALLCTQAMASLRPSMSKVVLLLSGKSQIKETPTRPPYVELEDVRSSTSSSRVFRPGFDQDSSINSSFNTQSFAVADITEVDAR